MLKRTVSKLPTLAVFAAMVLMFFSAAAFAQDAVVTAVAPTATDPSIWDMARPAFNAFSGGHYAYAAALSIVFLCAVVKGLLPKYFPNAKITKLTHTDAGGTALALVAAMGTACAAALAAPGAHVTASLLKTSFLVGVGAAGGYAALKNLVVEPLLKPLAAAKWMPVWAQPLFALAFWFFDHKTNDAAAIEASATKAGDAAVAAAPSAGVTAVVGNPTDVK